MPTPADKCVFISYARKDDVSLAQRLRRDLATKGFETWLDTNRISGGATWTVEIEQAIDRSQVVLALLTQGAYVSDICRAEQLRSLRKGKCVIPVRAQANTDIPLHLEAKNYRDFVSPGSYEVQFSGLLVDILGGRNAVLLPDKFRKTYVTAPPLPRNYIERIDALSKLRSEVIRDDPGPSIALTALRGMGGIGKTILAQALSHDELVQQAFPDGIIWSIAGKESPYDLFTRIREVRRALGDEPAGNESELECINRYRTLMRDKAALVIVDDVWRVSDIEPFLVESPRSRLLLTTRDASIAAAVGAEEHTANLLTVEQSRALLARWAGRQVQDLPTNADDLIDECEGLPLAISMVGAMLRGKPSAVWAQVRTLLQSADLEKIKAQFPNYPHTDLLCVIQVSVGDLDEIARQRYLALAVALEDMSIAPAIQQTLWNVDELEALSTAERFVGLSLAQRAGTLEESIRLHDLQLDYCRTLYPDREALTLIHGAVRLSSNVIGKDSTQFASQMVGRLLPYQRVAAINKFITELVDGAPKPCLRPLKPALFPPGTGLVCTLAGNSAVAVSADGRRAVSASGFTVKVWELDTGRELGTLEGHMRIVRAVAMSSDGRRAVSASEDTTLKVWDLDTRCELGTLKGHSNYVFAVAMSADGRRAVSASSDHTLKVWNLETRCELRSLLGHSDAVVGVAMSADGTLAISASRDKTLKIWDLETGRERGTLQGHLDTVRAVAMSANGRRAVSASSDQMLKVWDLETRRELRTLQGHSNVIPAVAMSADGRRAVSASRDKTLKVWDLETGRELHTLQGHLSPVVGVATSADCRIILSATPDLLMVWDLGTGPELRMQERHAGWVVSVAASADGRRAVSGSMDKMLKVWDLETGCELYTLQGHSDTVDDVALSADGHTAVSTSLHETLIWDLETGRELSRFSGSMRTVAVSADARRAISGSWKSLKVLDLESGCELHTLEGHSGLIHSEAISVDGRQAISASWDMTLKVWDLETGRELRTLLGHSGQVDEVVVSADWRRAVSNSVDETLVWDLETGRQLGTLEGHTGKVQKLVMSSDGRRAVFAPEDKTLKVWDLDTGRELRTLDSHSGPFKNVAVSPDGRRAVSDSYDVMTVWDLDNGVPLAVFTGDESFSSFAFLGNDRLVAGDWGGNVHLLSLEESIHRH